MKLQIIACDKCGTREEKKPVGEWSIRRGSTRYTGDICDKCFKDFLNEYKPSPLSKGRHVVEATKIEDIP